jgi:hypothetical protein
MNTTNNENDDSQCDIIYYHIDPEGVMTKNPNLRGKVEQALVLCESCNEWKNLSYENAITTDGFNYQTKRYRGYCLTNECRQKQEEIARQKRNDEKFWVKVRQQEKRCDEADARCEAFYKKAMEEANKNKEEREKTR